jgi:hypothetical protein
MVKIKRLADKLNADYNAMKPRSELLFGRATDLAKIGHHFSTTNQDVLNPYDAEIKQRFDRAEGLATNAMTRLKTPKYSDYKIAFNEALAVLYPNLYV